MKKPLLENLSLFCLLLFFNFLFISSGCTKKQNCRVYEDQEVLHTREVYKDVWIDEYDEGVISIEEFGKIAIYPLQGNSSHASYYTSAIENELLSYYSDLSVISRRQLETVIEEQDLGQSGRLNSYTISRLKEIFGVQVIITGEINEGSWMLQLIDTETAEIIWGANNLGSFSSTFPDVLYNLYGRNGHWENQLVEEEYYETERVATGWEMRDVPDDDATYAILGLICAGIIIFIAVMAEPPQ